LLGIAVVAMAVIAPVVLGASQGSEGALEVEDADLAFYYESSVEGSETDSFGTTGDAVGADGIVVIRVDGTTGDLTADEVTVRVPDSGGTLARETSYTEGEALRPGDTVRVWVDTSDTVRVVWQSSETDQSAIIGEHELPSTVVASLDDPPAPADGGPDAGPDDGPDGGPDAGPDDSISVEDGGVVPDEEYDAEVELLGTAYTFGVGGLDIPIELEIGVGSDSYEPWTGNVNDDGNPRTTTFDDRSAGEKVTVTATTRPGVLPVASRTRRSTDTGGYVKVLRDGDTPPNLAGFGDQDSAASYVQPYLAADGTIDIDDNQAIYLFELSDDQTGPAADYQDVVVLVTVRTG
jgi:hypothetical protein